MTMSGKRDFLGDVLFCGFSFRFACIRISPSTFILTAYSKFVVRFVCVLLSCEGFARNIQTLCAWCHSGSSSNRVYELLHTLEVRGVYKK